MNSLIFISDRDGGEAPEPVRGAKILSTSSCISVACYPEWDGPTEIVLGDVNEVDLGNQPAFNGELETPHRKIIVSTTGREKLLEMNVTKTRTQVTIWLNHPEWPERVAIGVS